MHWAYGQLRKGRATVLHKTAGWENNNPSAIFTLDCHAPPSLKGVPMPSYWTPKEERMYRHIKGSCFKRCRRGRVARKGRSCMSACERIAAATTNKFRKQAKKHGFRGLGVVRGKCCVVRGKKRVACFHSKKDAVALKAALKKDRGLKIHCV